MLGGTIYLRDLYRIKPSGIKLSENKKEPRAAQPGRTLFNLYYVNDF